MERERAVARAIRFGASVSVSGRNALQGRQVLAGTIKWKSPTFMFEGNIASIDPKAKSHVSLARMDFNADRLRARRDGC
jgi:hypothetical protein